MIEVRVLEADDWPLWRRLRRTALAEAPEAFSSRLAEWTGAGDTEERWRARFASVPFNVVLFVDGEPAGMVSGYVGASGDPELISLWVAPAARGRGVGDAAVRAVSAWAAQAAPGRAVTLSVRSHNRAALALYARNGFVDDGPSPDDPAERRMRHPAP